jgi:hypothetical protein
MMSQDCINFDSCCGNSNAVQFEPLHSALTDMKNGAAVPLVCEECKRHVLHRIYLSGI